MGRKYQMLRREQKSLNKQIRQKNNVRRGHGSDQCPLEAHPEQNGNAIPRRQEEAREPARNRYIHAGQQMKALYYHQHMYKAGQVQVKKPQRVLHANRRRGQKVIFGGGLPIQQLSSVMDKQSGKAVSHKADITRAVHEYFAGLIKSPKSDHFLSVMTDPDMSLRQEEWSKS